MEKVKQTSMKKTPIPVENAARILCSQTGWSEMTETAEVSTDNVVDASLKYRAAKWSPADVYDHPQAVVQDQMLSNLQKMKILQIWASKTVERQQSGAERAGAEGIMFLADIVSALKELVKAGQSSCPEHVNYEHSTS